MGTSKGYIPPKNEQWKRAKGAVTRMAKGTNGNTGVGKAISKYADAYMSTHLGKSNVAVVAGNVMNFINSVQRNGIISAAENIGIDTLLNKTGQELYKGLIDYFARDINTTDMQIIRKSLSDTLKRLEINQFKDLEEIDSEEFLLEFIIQFAIQNFETCFSEKIFSNQSLSDNYDRLMSQVSSAIENRIVADVQLEKKLDLDYASPEGQKYISSVCRECYDKLKKMEGQYEDLD
ncbi:hypothetical protein HNQ56_002247 [Anaerotaenia torta]|uniref:hypothetical protein n=1 Tax=Anaerotaenia torta TaxID=433293 RepID=UPI003D249652